MSKLIEQMSYFHMLNIINKRPLDVNIETINRCPLNCVFCCNRVYQRDTVVMDNGLFEDIVGQYYHIGGGALGLSSMQSDFFLDPFLIDRMRVIKKYKKKLWVYSTVPLISCKKFSDKKLLYILRYFDLLQISIHGHDEESYKNMAGINGFHVLYEQLKRIKRIIHENSLNIRIELHFRTNKKNELLRSGFYHELSRTFYVADVKDAFFSWFGTIKREELPKGAQLIYMKNEKKHENCAVPNATLAVMADGKVVGCGCIDWLEKYVIGDCKKNSLIEIWNSSKAKAFRNSFVRGKIPAICMECGLYTSISCMRNKKLIGYRPINGLYYDFIYKG